MARTVARMPFVVRRAGSRASGSKQQRGVELVGAVVLGEAALVVHAVVADIVVDL